MKLIWTYNHSPLSRAIRYTLSEPCSHFAIVFDERFVCHSNLYGVSLTWWKTFQKTQGIYAEANIPLPNDIEEKTYTDIFDTFSGTSYDFRAFLFFTKSALEFKYFGTPIPKANPYNNNGAFLCTEMYGVLPDQVLTKELKEEKKLDLSITSPYTLLKLCRQSGLNITVKG